MSFFNPFKKFSFMSKEYKFFALLITISIFCVYGMFVIMSYEDHTETYKKRYLSQNIAIANSYEIYLDNIFRQAEFIGHKIDKNNTEKNINDLLNHSFSLSVNLDTSLLSSWVKFEWVKKDSEKISNDELSRSISKPWVIHFGNLHSTGPHLKDHYIPISFGVTDSHNNFIGSLTSRININNLFEFLRHNLQNEHLEIVVMDTDYNIIGISSQNEITPPQGFFKDSIFNKRSGNFHKSFNISNTSYISYKRLDSYPFMIVLGDNKNNISGPLVKKITIYFAILLIALFTILSLLLIFYKKIINPITSLSSFAKNIISSQTKQALYEPQKHSFEEILNLEKALIKIKNYKTDLDHSNKLLNQKTAQLETIKQSLEEDLEKLSNSYQLRDELMKQSLKNNTNILPKETIEQCLTMLYPEIYSRQLNIESMLKKTPNLNIKYCDFVQLVTEILSRSFIFCKAKGTISIRTEVSVINNKNYFCLTIEDDGIGDEEWRQSKLDKSCKKDVILQLIKDCNGVLHHINNEDFGVKYCILIPYEENRTTEGKPKNNKIIPFPLKKS